MYNIEIYEDRNGRSDIQEYIKNYNKVKIKVVE